MQQLLQSLDHNTLVIYSISLILFAGFLLTRVTKKLKLPNVTAYLLTGMAIGPWALKLIPADIVQNMDFVTDIALAFIAFGVGRYFKLSTLRTKTTQMVVITLFESLAAAAVIALVMLALGLPLPFALLLGAIGCATAPASTIMTIRQYKAKGPFVDMVLQVVALDDAVALIAFSICTAVATASTTGHVGFGVVALPILFNCLGIAGGILCGFILKRLIKEKRSQDNRLILAVAMILFLTAACSLLSISPLLSCMALGAAYINCGGNPDLSHQIDNFTPPIMATFFVLSGMRLDMKALAATGIVGVIYFLVRIAGKYAGAFAGAKLCRAPKEISRYLGLALIPQAGVSIGLAALGQRLLPADMGAMLSTVILSSAVLYEIIGPACAKLSLHLSGAIPKPAPEAEQASPHVEESRQAVKAAPVHHAD